MKVIIKPSKTVGRVAAPPSKSMAHRYLICAGLSFGESTVRNIALSKDIEATIDCLRALGADIRLDGDTAYIKGVELPNNTPLSVLFCNESGSTLRFFAPLCMLSGEKYVLRGSEYLFTRPLSVYEDIAEKQGIRFDKTSNSLTVQGRLKSGIYEVPGNISSQFISGLLFALPLLEGDSVIRVLPPFESRPYIDMTVEVLNGFGITVRQDGDTYYISGDQSYLSCDITVEGDWSNAAFFEALNYAGSNVEIEGLNDASLQGDKVYKILYKKIITDDDVIDISDCPDLGPVLFAVAALRGGGRFSGTRRLRMKESDRAEAMREELAKFGVDVIVDENTVEIRGRLIPPVEPLFSHGDHRIAMALAVLCTVTGGTIIGAEAVSKSFPDFFEKLSGLGVDLEYGMD